MSCSSLLSDPAISELLAFCGCDMVWIDMGVQMLSFGQDMNLLVQAAKSNIQNISAALEESSDANTMENTP